MHTPYHQYLEKLISFQSITPSDNGAMEYLKDILTEQGFVAEVMVLGDDKYKVSNLYATFGNRKPNICFAGHIDVVPAGDLSLWRSDPFVMTTKDDKIYGRGAVDMKGALACMLSATFEYIKTNPTPNGSISFLITADEEGEAKYGTRMMLEHLKNNGRQIDLAILGEPTSGEEIGDAIKIGRRGSINFTLEVKGVQGHVAYPMQADNPVDRLVRIMHDLITNPLDEGSQFFQSSNLELTSVDVGNNVSNIIPQTAFARFNVRFNDLHTDDTIINLVRQTIEKYTVNYELTTNIAANVFVQSPQGLIADFAEVVRKTTGLNTKFSTSGGTSDARFIKDYCQVVEFGLLYKMAHKINEYTKNSDLQKLHNVYYRSLCQFLG